MKSISDLEFANEMRILWINISDEKRNDLGEIIREYFGEGERAEKILNKMQEKIDLGY